MDERPQAIESLNSFLSTSAITHEVIFDLHRQLASAGRSTQRAGELLNESAQLTLRKLPSLAARARDLATQWEEQTLLDPDAAAGTKRQLALELDQIRPKLELILDRQRAIAAALRSL